MPLQREINLIKLILFTDKFFDYARTRFIFGIFVPLLFASIKSFSKCSSCIRFTYWLIFWIFLLRSSSYSHCRVASTLLYCNAYSKSFVCTKVIFISFNYHKFKFIFLLILELSCLLLSLTCHAFTYIDSTIAMQLIH